MHAVTHRRGVIPSNPYTARVRDLMVGLGRPGHAS